MSPSGCALLSGGYRDDVTPVPIPNTEVKLIFGDDTWIIKSWESSTLPVLSKKTSQDVFFVWVKRFTSKKESGILTLNIIKHRRKERTDMKMTETTTEKYSATCMPLFGIGIAGDHGLATDVFRYGKVN